MVSFDTSRNNVKNRFQCLFHSLSQFLKMRFIFKQLLSFHIILAAISSKNFLTEQIRLFLAIAGTGRGLASVGRKGQSSKELQ